jgi:serine/threonine protein phosphatase 1
MSDGRIFAIGDIHGCPDELSALLGAVGPAAGDTLCFLGDYVDRGPASREVVDLLIDLAAGPAHCVFLRGNHEDMLLDFIGRSGRFGDAFLDNGGATTLRSYGLPPRRDPDLDRMLPDDHLAFFESLQLRWDAGRCLCVHAGVRPTLPLDQQREEDLLWIREDFFGRPHSFGKVVLYGHTPRRSVEIAPPYRIGLDTGLVYGGCLSCLDLGDRVLWQVARHSRAVESRSLAVELGDLRLA